ncbi:hypothetical protein, partial [Gemmatimonas sp.]
AVSSVVASCRDTLAPTDLTPVPKLEEHRPRQTVAGAWAPEPGSCTRTFTAADSGGALEPTGCFLEPQSVNNITIDGMLTAAPSPRSTCCIVTTYPESGTYGPMGGTGSMWMQLLVRMRLIESGTLSTRVVTGSSFGSPASSVTITDVYETGSRGRAVWLERTPVNISVSCGGNPPAAPCPHNGYVAWKYRVSGTQTVTVRRIAKTLQVNVSPVGTIYEGDTVTFTARSSDNRPVTVVRDWIWRDSTGTPSFVPCYSAVCRWVPPNSGIMYVYAKVGTNPFFEQASARVDVTPLALRVHVLRDATPATAGTVVSFVANAVPDVRPVKQLAIASAPGLTDAICSADAFCDALAVSSDSVSLSATINGRPKSVKVFVDVMSCAVSDSLLPSPACLDPNRWENFWAALTPAQRAAVMSLSAADRSACRQDLTTCRRWLDEGGTYPTPSDSVSYEEIAALTDAVHGELVAMSANWDGQLMAFRASGQSTDVPRRASLVTTTPDNALDLLLLLYDLGEIALAGPNAERVRGLALDLAFAVAPVSNPRVLAAGQKASRAAKRNMQALWAAARRGREEHVKFSERLWNSGQIGAIGVKYPDGRQLFIDGIEIIDNAVGEKIIRIFELKPRGSTFGEIRGAKQLVDYKVAIQSTENLVITRNNQTRVIPVRDMLNNRGFRVETKLDFYD